MKYLILNLYKDTSWINGDFLKALSLEEAKTEALEKLTGYYDPEIDDVGLKDPVLIVEVASTVDLSKEVLEQKESLKMAFQLNSQKER